MRIRKIREQDGGQTTIDGKRYDTVDVVERCEHAGDVWWRLTRNRVTANPEWASWPGAVTDYLTEREALANLPDPEQHKRIAAGGGKRGEFLAALDARDALKDGK